MSLRFWIRTLLHRYTPGGFGHMRRLRRERDASYDHERDKAPVRHKHYGNEGWSKEKRDNLRYRDYENYDEYLAHQVTKFGEIMKTSGFSNKVITEYRKRFFRRFRHLRKLKIPRDARILCLGARQGTEVEVLRDLGYRNALGLDLNPGPDNPYVVHGDFMHLDYQAGSVDLVFTNCVDHAFELNDFFAEHARVIKDDGYVLYDITTRGAGAFEAVDWDREEDLFRMMLRHFRSVQKVETDRGWKWILLQGKVTPAASTTPVAPTATPAAGS